MIPRIKRPRARTFFLLFAPLLLLAGCGEDSPDAQDETADAVSVAPATKEAIVVIGETAEPMTLHRYEAPTGAPIAFSTYLPEGMEAAAEAQPSGDWKVGFGAESGSSTDRASIDAASLDVVFFPDGTTEEQGRARARELAEEAGSGSASPGLPPRWGLVEHRFDGEGTEGFASLGQHEGRFYALLMQYPPRLRDDFLPRAAWILEEWAWSESGQPLHALETP